jgi:hypothetical protein
VNFFISLRLLLVPFSTRTQLQEFDNHPSLRPESVRHELHTNAAPSTLRHCEAKVRAAMKRAQKIEEKKLKADQKELEGDAKAAQSS